ncbi:MAG: ATP-binding protein [Bdellovibrionota bacterium]
MKKLLSPFQRISTFSRSLVLLIAIVTIFGGLLVLAGWAFEIALFKSVIPGWVAMKPNTAICFVLTGLSLIFYKDDFLSSASARWVGGMTAGVLVATVGILTLLEQRRGFDFGIDCLFFQDSMVKAGGAPGRMAMLSAINFIFIGVALIGMRFRASVAYAQFFAVVTGLIALSPWIGNRFGTSELQFGVASFAQMAAHTTVFFVFVSAAALLACSRKGWVGIARSHSVGGTMVRRLVPLLVAILLSLTWVRYEGQNLGYFNLEFGVSLMSLGSTVLLSGAALWCARLINKIEAKQQEAADQVNTLNAELEHRVLLRTEELQKAVETSEKQQALLEIAHFRIETILSNAPIAIFALDQQLRFTYCDGKALRDGGLRPSDLIGDSAPERYRSLAWMRDGINRAATGETVAVQGGQGARYFEALLTPVRDSASNVTGVIGLTIDVTESKRAQDERAQSEIRESAAKESSRIKSEFLANMSHEIRTPINGVIGLTGLLLDSNLDPEQRDYAETIRTSGESLLAIVSDILDLSKVESGKMTLEVVDFDVVHLVKSVHRSLQLSADKKHIELHAEFRGVGEHCYVRGDLSRTRQVLINLVSNAIKFTDSGSVTTRLTLLGIVDGQMNFRFDVVDSGIGISATALNRLFQAFSQADLSTTRRFGGTGLGLSICKQLVELMGGKITAESREGQGSTFTFTIVFDAGDDSRIVGKTDAFTKTLARSSTPIRVLVAEDNSTNQKVILAMLKKLGCSADAVANGNEVLSTLRQVPYDVVLMDCQMPELDGYQTTRMIRSSTTLSCTDIPVIALTANAIAGEKERCLEAGMNDYLSKPIRIEKLFQTLSLWIPASASALDPMQILTLRSLDADGSDQVLAAVFESFVREGQGLIKKIGDAISGLSAEALADAAHSLKSAAANVGAVEVATHCAGLETQSLANDLSGASQRFDILSAEFDRAIQEIKIFSMKGA